MPLVFMRRLLPILPSVSYSNVTSQYIWWCKRTLPACPDQFHGMLLTGGHAGTSSIFSALITKLTAPLTASCSSLICEYIVHMQHHLHLLCIVCIRDSNAENLLIRALC